jgi:hypothetical protein
MRESSLYRERRIQFFAFSSYTCRYNSSILLGLVGVSLFYIGFMAPRFFSDPKLIIIFYFPKFPFGEAIILADILGWISTFGVCTSFPLPLFCIAIILSCFFFPAA